MSQAEAAIPRAGALVELAAASALMRFPAAEQVVLALHAVFLLGCATVQLSPAHRTVAGLARRPAEAAWGMVLGASAAGLRWAGFDGILLYAALYVAGNVRTEASLDKVEDFLLFLMFLAGVWAVYLSTVTGRGAPTPRLAAAAEEDIEGGEADAMAPRSAVGAAREILAVQWRAATELRWVGFTGMVVYAVYVVGDLRKEPAAAKEVVSVDKVNGLLLFLVFVAGVLTVNLSMLTARASEPATLPPLPAAAKEVTVHKVNGLLLFFVFLAGVLTVNLSITGRVSEPAPPPPLPAAAAAEEQLGGGEVNVMLPSSVRVDDPKVRKIKDEVRSFLLFLVFLAGVWAVYLSMVNGRGAPPWRPAAATAEEKEELDGGEVNAMAPRSARVVVDSKL